MTSAAVPRAGGFTSPAPELVAGRDTRRHPAVIVGGGPVGLVMSLCLARHGIASLLIDAEDTVCAGSRAIGIARRSLELLDALGVVGSFMQKGLTRLGSRAYARSKELGFRPLVHPETDRFPPMINLQQSYVERFLVEALDAEPLSTLRWSTILTGLAHDASGARLTVASPHGSYRIDAEWVIACDGASSATRQLLDLRMEGSAYSDRFLIIDVRMPSTWPSERRIWFNPESNPRSTVIMHKQADDEWRVDFRLPPDIDIDAALRPEAVAERVARHLAFIGEDAPWQVTWVSTYQARALTLPSYRYGRVLFAGDAAHLVPIFGARGMNSGFEDVHNLGWKLARVIRGEAADALLDSYSPERRSATLANIGYASMGTEFVAPQSWGAEVMREAVITLAPTHPVLESLMDPRTSDPSAYPDSPLNVRTADEATCAGGVPVGATMSDAPVRVVEDGFASDAWLGAICRRTTSVLVFTVNGRVDPDLALALAQVRSPLVEVHVVALGLPDASASGRVLHDHTGAVAALYGAQPGTVYVLRPDQFVLARWRTADRDEVVRAVESLGRPRAPREVSA